MSRTASDDVVAAFVARTWRFVRGRSKEQIAAGVGALGLLSYAALYFAYFQFYVSFGLRPSEVGLSRVRLVEESIIGLVLVPYALARAYVGQLCAAIVGVVVVRAAVRAVRRRSVVGLRALREHAATALVTAVVLLVVAGGVGYVRLVRDARSLGNEVRREGRIVVSWVNRRTDIYLPYLDLQAIPVDVVGPEPTAGEAVTDGCALYLGRADGLFVLFDVRRDVVVRLPADGLELTTHPNLRPYTDERLPARCLSDDGNEAE
jgi:hypothetical protein